MSTGRTRPRFRRLSYWEQWVYRVSGQVVKTRGAVSYNAWQTNLPRICARRAARTGWDGLLVTSYQFEIAKRGQSYKYFTFAKEKE